MSNDEKPKSGFSGFLAATVLAAGAVYGTVKWQASNLIKSAFDPKTAGETFKGKGELFTKIHEAAGGLAPAADSLSAKLTKAMGDIDTKDIAKDALKAAKTAQKEAISGISEAMKTAKTPAWKSLPAGRIAIVASAALVTFAVGKWISNKLWGKTPEQREPQGRGAAA